MNRLKELRQNVGLSQQSVANALKITQQAYANYESGKREPDQKNLSLLADYYNTSIDYILKRTDDPTPPDAKKEASPSSDRETLKEALIKAGIIPVDRDLTDAEYALLFGAAKGLFENLDK